MTGENEHTQPASPKHLDPLERTGRRPRFHALWHLKTLGVAEEIEAFESAAWEKVYDSQQGHAPADPVRVAIIDTLPAFTHPNLTHAIDIACGMDFTTDSAGKDLPALPDSGSAFGAHGTSVAGLIAARPGMNVILRVPGYIDPDAPLPPASTTRPIALPFAGINPFATIVPIVVSAAPDPEMILAALHYAGSAQAAVDIVVIADSWDRAGTAYDAGSNTKAGKIPTGYGSQVPKSAADSKSPGQDNRWTPVEEALRKLCTETFVFCAAGNEPRSRLVYPASLSTPKVGPWAVGACDKTGHDLTYTPKSGAVRRNGHRLITTLSSEHPRLDQIVQKLDPWAKNDSEMDLPDWLFDQNFQPTDIVSTDVPGPAGYNPSPYDHVPSQPGDEHLEVASLYCRFSGTSAATALAAGLVSLAIALQRAGEQGDATPNHASQPYKGPPPEKPELFTLEQARELARLRPPAHSEPKEN